MAVSMRKARDYVFSNGTLWERALYSYMFDGGPLARVHQCLLGYKNPDGGWGHGLEHDIRAPYSHPLALEYLLTVIRDFDLPVGNLLDGTAQWVTRNRDTDGSLCNPSALREYPMAPWWVEGGGQTMPDSIVGNLTRLGLVTPPLAESTQVWVQANVNLDRVRSNNWLFMAYHAYDYFMNVRDFPDSETYRLATVQNIVECAMRAPEKQYYSLFAFAPTPESPVARALPDGLLERYLDYLQESQREDGSWSDEHGLPQWMPMVTVGVLQTLKRFGRL